jgi:hypothetical protein
MVTRFWVCHCPKAAFIVPTLWRGNVSGNAPALRDAGASLSAFPRWSVGTMEVSEVEDTMELDLKFQEVSEASQSLFAISKKLSNETFLHGSIVGKFLISRGK